MARTKSIEALNLDFSSYADAINKGHIVRKSVEITVGTNADGTPIKVSAETLVPVDTDGALTMLGQEAHLIRAAKAYFHAAVAGVVRADNTSFDKQLLPTANKLVKLKGSKFYGWDAKLAAKQLAVDLAG